MVAEQLLGHRAPARLSVSPCSSGPALVVVIDGAADWVTAGQLRDGLAAALAYGPRSVVLDVADLEFCNLAGLRALLAAVEAAERSGAVVTVHGMSRQLAWLYEGFATGYRSCPRSSGSEAPAHSPSRSVPLV
jgi:anti-anti-sigma factor